MADIFISYSSRNSKTAADLAKFLEGEDILGADQSVRKLTVWWDKELIGGEIFHSEIARQIDLSGVVLVLWCPAAISSDWVYAEAMRGASARKLVSVTTADVGYTEIPLPFSAFHSDVVNEKGAVLRSVLARLRGERSPLPGTTAATAKQSWVLDPKYEPLPNRAAVTRPASLLLAKHRVVEFDDIHNARNQFIEWATVTPEWSLGRTALGRLVYGPGGYGKTRLLVEVCETLFRDYGWLAGFVPRDVRGAGRELAERALEKLIYGQDAAGFLLVVDYAEGREADVVWLAEKLVRRSEDITKPARLVLISRGGGEWWHALLQKNQYLQELCSRGQAQYDEICFQDQIDWSARDRLFTASSSAFIARRQSVGQKVPDHPPSRVLLSALKNNQEYDSPLALQLAALLYVFGFDTDEHWVGLADLLQKILGLEYDVWDRSLGLSSSSNMPDALKRGVSQVTLATGVDTASLAAELLAHDSLYSQVKDIDVPRVQRALSLLFPGVGDGLSALEPDLIGEHHIACTADDGLIDACMTWAGDDADRRRSILTVLNRATRPEHGEAGKRASQQLVRLVDAQGSNLMADLVAVAVGTPGDLWDILARKAAGMSVGVQASLLESVKQEIRTLEATIVDFSDSRIRRAYQLAAAIEKIKSSGWSSRPIYISSTFADMCAERDHLMMHVIPALQEWLRTKRRHLEWIDLRYGVASTDGEGEATREPLVLKVCLDEVRRSRPFLIALIGDRYGWVPPHKLAQEVTKEVGFKGNFADRSITELEIDFGVFQASDQPPRHCLFFLRAPLPYDAMLPEIAARYSDAHATDVEAAKRRERLAALKSRIRAEFGDRCSDYAVTWNGPSQSVTGLEAWGQYVYAKIRQSLEEEIALEQTASEGHSEVKVDRHALVRLVENHEHSIGELNEVCALAEQSVDNAERDNLADFAENRARGFIGRKDVLGEIEALLGSPADEGAPWGLCVTGEAGSGKSALFGILYQGLMADEKDDVLVLAHAAGASLSAASVDAMLRRWIGELAKSLGIEPNLAENAGPDKVDAVFSSLLGHATLKRRVIVLLDALDQFEPTPRRRLVTWLPRLWPKNARFIATAIPGEASEVLAKRPGLSLRPMSPLDAVEARMIVEAISLRYHRTLGPQVLDTLIAGDGRWSNPLWLVLAAEKLNLLDTDDFARAKRDFIGRDEERLRALMCEMAASFPPDVLGLYQQSFAHAADLFGKPLVQAFLGLIAVSRSGWRDSDFRILLPKVSGDIWDELRFVQLRRSFRGQMRARGAMEQSDFACVQMRIAAKGWLIDTGGPAEVSLHTAIGDHLLALPSNDPVRVSETMVHLMKGDGWARRAAEYYGATSLTDFEAAGATRVLTDIVLTAPKDDPTAGAKVVAMLLDVSEGGDSVTGRVVHRFVYDLDTAISECATQDLKHAIAAASSAALVRLIEMEPSNQLWLRDLSILRGKIGDMLVAQGNLPGALTNFRDGLAVAERLACSDPGSADWQRDLLRSWNRIGDVLVAQGNLSGALKAFRDGFAIAERLERSDPANDGWKRDLSVSGIKIGDVLVAQGNLPEALIVYRDSHEIVKRLASSDIGDVDWQRDLSVSWNRIGEVLVAQGNLSGALAAFRNCHAIAERLAHDDPGNAACQRDLSVSYGKIGEVLVAQGNLPQSLRAFRDSHTIAKRLAKSDPGNVGWQRDLSVSFGRIGDMLVAQGDLPEALRAFRDGLAVRERLTQIDPGNAGWQRDLSVSFDRIGDVLKAQGRLSDALNAFRDGLAIAEHLARRDPGNAGWQRDLSVSFERIGDVLVAQGSLFEALKAFRDSHAIFERLARGDPGNAGWQRDLSVSWNKIGDVLVAQGNMPEALKAFRNGHAINERLARSDPGNVGWQRDFSVSWNRIGDVLLAQGYLPEAQRAFRDGLAIAERLTQGDGSNIRAKLDLGVSYARLGQVSEALGDLATGAQYFADAQRHFEYVLAIAPGFAEAERMAGTAAQEAARLGAKASQQAAQPEKDDAVVARKLLNDGDPATPLQIIERDGV